MLILGLGNRLRGDDGLGPAVIDQLRKRIGEPAGVTLRESAGGDLAEQLARDDLERVVVIDAAELRRSAGAWVQISGDDLAAPAFGHPTRLAHGFGLAESLALLAALGVRPAPISIYAVQPGWVEWGRGLSPAVRCTAARLADHLAADLRSDTDPTAGEGKVVRRNRDIRACRSTSKRRMERKGGIPWRRSS